VGIIARRFTGLRGVNRVQEKNGEGRITTSGRREGAGLFAGESSTDGSRGEGVLGGQGNLKRWGDRTRGIFPYKGKNLVRKGRNTVRG